MKRKTKTPIKYLGDIQPGKKVILKAGNGYYIEQNFKRAENDIIGIVKYSISCNEIYVTFENGIYARCIDNTLTLLEG